MRWPAATIVRGPLYLLAGPASDVSATLPARYITLTYQVPRKQNICVQELLVTALIDRFHKYVMISEDQFPYGPIGGYGQYNAANANYPGTLLGYCSRDGRELPKRMMHCGAGFVANPPWPAG